LIDSSSLARQVADICLEEVLGPAPEAAVGGGASEGSALDAAEAERLAGMYRMTEGGVLIEIHDKDGQLTLSAGEQDIKLTNAHGRVIGVYGDVAIDIELSPGDHGGGKLELVHNGEPLITALEVRPPELTPADVDQLVGDYYSDEVDAKARITEEGRKVYWQRGAAPRAELRPTLPDEFSTGIGGARFTRDEGGAITGFKASMARAQGVQFERT
jgi:hypothetical protein